MAATRCCSCPPTGSSARRRAPGCLSCADGTLVVPRLRGILASVTRSWAVDVTGAVEADVPLAELLAARGAAVLTAGRGVIPIAAVDDTPLARDPLFDALHTTWRGLP